LAGERLHLDFAHSNQKPISTMRAQYLPDH
jgi:hypothetical protein